MKKLLILTAIVSTAFIRDLEATPFLPHLGPLRAQIVNQQVVVSNAPTLNKPLATALRKALLQIDRTTATNLVNDTKALSSITATLNKTSLSNVFDPLIRTALGNYVGVIGASLHSLSNSLLTTFPSGPHTAADKLINAAFDSVEAVIANGNTALATKALAVVVKKLPPIQNLLTKAINANAPPAQITATVTGSFNTTIKTQGAGIVAGAGLVLNGAQQAGLGVKGISFVIDSVANGTQTANISAGAITQVKFPGVTTAFTIEAGDSGTATVTRNNANRTAFGTFTFTATGVQGTTGNITVTGQFFGTF